MTKATVFTATLLATLFASGASADCSNLSCNDVYIENIYVDSGELGNGEIWVQTSGTETALNCTPNNGIQLKLSSQSTSTHRKEVYAMLLMAFSMDKPVSIRIVPATTGCDIGYVYVNR